MLYQIDGTSTRLLGTMHLVPQGQQGWIPYVRRSFDWSEKRVLEMHLRRIPELLGLRSPHPRDLPADIQQRVEDRWNAESLGPLESVNLPMMLLVIGGMNIEAMKGVEAQLIDWASGEDDFGELESPAEMLEAFANVPAQTFVDALRWRLPRDAEAAQRLAQIYRAWRGNSADKMMKITRIGLPEPIREAMFDQRNRLWAPRVCELAKRSERTLVCVGAGHLHGKNNLRDLLAWQGLTCSRIQP